MLKSIQILTRASRVEIYQENGLLHIYVDENTKSINETNFDEFCDVVLEMVQLSRYKNPIVQPPVFKSEEGRRRWEELQKQRQRNKSKTNTLTVSEIINYVQFGMGGYLSDEDIKNMTYWKLLKSYESINQKSNYIDSFSVYLQCGDKKLIDKHWSELVKL